MAKYLINPAPGTSTGWGRFLSGKEYELTDEQVEKFTRKGIIGPSRLSAEATTAPSPANRIGPTEGVTHIGPTGVMAATDETVEEQDAEHRKAPKKGRNAVSVNPES